MSGVQNATLVKVANRHCVVALGEFGACESKVIVEPNHRAARSDQTDQKEEQGQEECRPRRTPAHQPDRSEQSSEEARHRTRGGLLRATDLGRSGCGRLGHVPAES
jgi:hypothetical protein